MRKVIQPCLLTLFTGISGFSFSQEKGQFIVSSAGDVSKGGGIILEWTLGEPAIETLSSSTTLYTQGFHQPLLEVKKIGSDRNLAALNTVRVYPNPSSAIINVQLVKPTEKRLSVSLIDGNGKTILNDIFPTNSSSLRINVSRLSGGVYILRIIDASGVIQGDYKIIKAQ